MIDTTAPISGTVVSAELAVQESATPPAMHARTSLPAKVQYAKMLADSELLPAQYRRKPANILYAIEYGDMLHIPPMAAINGIHIIEGKPTGSAALISALVRRAGHKLHVGYDTQKRMGWAEIIRCDDPGFTYRSEWDLDRAVMAELCTVKNGEPHATDSKNRSLPWKKFFPSMTKARAITEVARDACEEALCGVHYTPEELGVEVDGDGALVTVPPAGPPGPEDNQAWVTAKFAAIESLTDLDAVRDLYREAAAKRDAGEVSPDEARRVQDATAARAAALEDDLIEPKAESVTPGQIRDEPAGPVAVPPAAADLSPAWGAMLDQITSAEDGDRSAEEVDRAMEAGEIDARQEAAIHRAIKAKVASLAPKDTAPATPAAAGRTSEDDSAFGQRLAGAGDDDAKALQNEVRAAVRARHLTPAAANLRLKAIEARRRELQGAPA